MNQYIFFNQTKYMFLRLLFYYYFISLHILHHQLINKLLFHFFSQPNNILQILIHQAMFQHHIHPMHHFFILLHKLCHLDANIFHNHLLYRQFNALQIYLHQHDKMFLYHELYHLSKILHILLYLAIYASPIHHVFLLFIRPHK